MTSRNIALFSTTLLAVALAGGCPAERPPVVGQKCASDADCAGPYICRQPGAGLDRVCLFGIRPPGENPEPSVEPEVLPEPGVAPEPEPGVVPEPFPEPEPIPEPEPDGGGECEPGYIYDATGTCTRTRQFPSLNRPRALHTATQAADDFLFIAGGLADDQTAPAETALYDAAGNLLPSPELQFAAYAGRSASLPNGNVLLVGGLTVDSAGNAGFADSYSVDPLGGTEVFLAPIGTPRYLHAMAPADTFGGRFHLIGGFLANPNVSAPVTTYDVGGGVTTFAGQPEVGILPLVVPLSANRSMVIAGLDAQNGETNLSGTYAIEEDGQLSPLAPFPEPLFASAAVFDPNQGMVIVAGGQTPRGVLDEVWAYDEDLDSWTFVGALSSPRAGHSMVICPNTGRIYVIGGATAQGGAVATVEVLQVDAAAGQTSSTVITTLSEARQSVEVTIFGDGLVAISGGINNAGLVSGAVDVIDAYPLAP